MLVKTGRWGVLPKSALDVSEANFDFQPFKYNNLTKSHDAFHGVHGTTARMSFCLAADYQIVDSRASSKLSNLRQTVKHWKSVHAFNFTLYLLEFWHTQHRAVASLRLHLFMFKCGILDIVDIYQSPCLFKRTQHQLVDVESAVKCADINVYALSSRPADLPHMCSAARWRPKSCDRWLRCSSHTWTQSTQRLDILLVVCSCTWRERAAILTVKKKEKKKKLNLCFSQ